MSDIDRPIVAVFTRKDGRAGMVVIPVEVDSDGHTISVILNPIHGKSIKQLRPGHRVVLRRDQKDPSGWSVKRIIKERREIEPEWHHAGEAIDAAVDAAPDDWSLIADNGRVIPVLVIRSANRAPSLSGGSLTFLPKSDNEVDAVVQWIAEKEGFQ